MSLRRSVGTWGLLFAGLSGMIGSGWLFGPFNAAQFAGPASVLSWVIGGFLMMVIAMIFAELSSTFPMAGGTVRFLQLSHGPLVSYCMAWIGWISAAAIAPIETMAVIQYASNYIPNLIYSTVGRHNLTPLGIFVTASLLLLMCYINILGAKLLARTNVVVSIIKLMVPVITIVYLFSNFHAENFVTHGFNPYGFEAILTALPTAGVIFSFIGHSTAVQLAGEAKTPQRSLPIAILGALFIVICLYVTLQIAFIGGLEPSNFVNGWHTLSFTGDAGPFAGIAVALGAFWLATFLYADATISPFGTALIYTAATARICYAMGENGYLPKPLMKLNKHGIPHRIIGLNFLIGVTLLLPFPSWQRLVGFFVASLVFAYAVGPLALPVLRKTLPNQERPFRLPAHRVLCIFGFYISNLLICWSQWQVVSKMIIAIVIGYLLLFIFRKTKQGRELNFQWKKAWWIFLYVASIGIISYLGPFGGIGLIKFGWDFLVIAIQTWVIFEISQVLALRDARHFVES